jgi:deoxyadenosine/deoxycytidine kinase
MRKPYIVSIEGNIGSGKTTLIDLLEKSGNENFIYLREPLDLWEKIYDTNTGENILQKFYNDNSKYSFPFQMVVYITFLERIKNAIDNANDDTIIICERSLESSHGIFAKMLKDGGFIEDINYKILELFYNTTRSLKIDAIVYLDTEHTLCNERIKHRDRLGEQEIPMVYLEKCNEYHKTWLESVKDIPILTLDTSLSEQEKLTQIHIFLRQK